MYDIHASIVCKILVRQGSGSSACISYLLVHHLPTETAPTSAASLQPATYHFTIHHPVKTINILTDQRNATWQILAVVFGGIVSPAC